MNYQAFLRDEFLAEQEVLESETKPHLYTQRCERAEAGLLPRVSDRRETKMNNDNDTLTETIDRLSQAMADYEAFMRTTRSYQLSIEGVCEEGSNE